MSRWPWDHRSTRRLQMVTRPGSSPMPAWMEKMNGLTRDTLQLRRTFRKLALISTVLAVGSVILGDVVLYRARGRHMDGYTSQLRVGGIPLLSIGRNAHGVFAVGAIAVGRYACGAIAYGRSAASGAIEGLIG